MDAGATGSETMSCDSSLDKGPVPHVCPPLADVGHRR